MGQWTFLRQLVRSSATVVGLSFAVVVAIVTGTIAWASASDGSKQAELGAGLVSSGVFGVLLLLFERALSAETEAVGRKVSLAASPTPAVDTASAEPAPTPSDEEGASEEGAFRVEVDGWMRDGSRIDAEQLRLRVYRDGRYFQFFTAIVPGSAFRVGLHGTRDITLPQFRRAIAEAAVEQIREKIALGEAPLPDPTKAIEIFPDIDTAVERGAHLPSAEVVEGDVIGGWQTG